MNIFDQGYAIGNMVKMFTLFFIAFYFMPSMVIQSEIDSDDSKERFFPVLIKGTFFTILAVHVASVANLMDSMAILILTIISLAISMHFHRKNKALDQLSLLDRFIIYLMDLADSGMSFLGKIIFLTNTTLAGVKALVMKTFRKIMTAPVLYGLNFVTFGYALYVRTVHPITHYYLPSSDAYLHLVWTKYIRQQSMYQDGLYPHGMHTAFAYMSTIFNTDAYYFYRYMGPLIGMLILFSIYHFVKHNFKSHLYTPWLATAIYVFVSTLPVQVWRQLSPLPQEYAMVFMLPTLHFLIQYVETHRKSHLWLYGLGLSLNFLIHFYSGFFILIGSLLYWLFNWKGVIQSKKIVPIFGCSILGIGVGFLPLAVGYILGIPFHASFEFFKKSTSGVMAVGSKMDVLSLSDLLQIDSSLLVAVLSALLVLGLSLFYAREQFAKYAMSSGLTLLTYLFYRGDVLGFPMPMLPDRSGVFLSVFAAVSIGLFAGLLLTLTQRFIASKVFESILALTVFALLLGGFGVHIPQGTQYEYDQGVQAYLAIVEGQPKGTMTIIGPQEQFQQIYGQGYHYQLWTLVKEQTDPLVKEIKIPTTDVYVFVEKIPFGNDKAVSLSDATLKFPSVDNNLTAYYTQYRNIIEAKAYYWAESFMKTHLENTSVYFEDAYMKIYRIHQDQLNPLDLKTKLPQEVFGQ